MDMRRGEGWKFLMWMVLSSSTTRDKGMMVDGRRNTSTAPVWLHEVEDIPHTQPTSSLITRSACILIIVRLKPVGAWALIAKYEILACLALILRVSNTHSTCFAWVRVRVYWHPGCLRRKGSECTTRRAMDERNALVLLYIQSKNWHRFLM